ncbi:hypothetical protein WA171_003297, partial [Blastocystis sp. BT1]
MDNSANEHEDKRMKMTTIETKYGEHRLKVLNDKLRDIMTTELELIDKSPEDQYAIADESYRLFGVSSFLMKEKDLTCLRFDTCYHGRYYEIYYIFLEFPPVEESRIPKIAAHTLPNCMPVKDWEGQYLSIDIQSFTQCVSLHLNSYIARREQVRTVEKDFGKDVEVTSSESFCSINLQFDDCIIKLFYNPDERIPHSVERVMSPTATVYPQIRAKKAGLSQRSLDLFKEVTMDVAVRNII